MTQCYKFGLAKRLNPDPVGTRCAASPISSTGEWDAAQRVPTALTLTGQVLGSPNFMPPEQAAGRRGQVGVHSDLYSLGAVLYHLLTARPPFVAESVHDTLRLVAEQEPVSLRLLNPAVPRDLETVCLKWAEQGTAPSLRHGAGLGQRTRPLPARRTDHRSPRGPPGKNLALVPA